MKTQIVEVTNGPKNWGKFLIGQFDSEWQRESAIVNDTLAEMGVSVSRGLLKVVGWTPLHFLLVDLQTGEGAIFKKGGLAHADLQKHKVWVCPMFEPFLAWLYERSSLADLPAQVDLPNAPFAMSGYRRPGQEQER
jgi:hypothetical protein